MQRASRTAAPPQLWVRRQLRALSVFALAAAFFLSGLAGFFYEWIEPHMCIMPEKPDDLHQFFDCAELTEDGQTTPYRLMRYGSISEMLTLTDHNSDGPLDRPLDDTVAPSTKTVAENQKHQQFQRDGSGSIDGETKNRRVLAAAAKLEQLRHEKYDQFKQEMNQRQRRMCRRGLDAGGTAVVFIHGNAGHYPEGTGILDGIIKAHEQSDLQVVREQTPRFHSGPQKSMRHHRGHSPLSGIRDHTWSDEQLRRIASSHTTPLFTQNPEHPENRRSSEGGRNRPNERRADDVARDANRGQQRSKSKAGEDKGGTLTKPALFSVDLKEEAIIHSGALFQRQIHFVLRSLIALGRAVEKGRHSPGSTIQVKHLKEIPRDLTAATPTHSGGHLRGFGHDGHPGHHDLNGGVRHEALELTVDEQGRAPLRIVLVGHSMGGVVARSVIAAWHRMRLSEELTHVSFSGVLAVASPLAAPPIWLDTKLKSSYDAAVTDSLQRHDIPLVSISGGDLDYMVHPLLSSSIPGVDSPNRRDRGNARREEEDVDDNERRRRNHRSTGRDDGERAREYQHHEQSDPFAHPAVHNHVSSLELAHVSATHHSICWCDQFIPAVSSGVLAMLRHADGAEAIRAHAEVKRSLSPVPEVLKLARDEVVEHMPSRYHTFTVQAKVPGDIASMYVHRSAPPKNKRNERTPDVPRASWIPNADVPIIASPTDDGQGERHTGRALQQQPPPRHRNGDSPAAGRDAAGPQEGFVIGGGQRGPNTNAQRQPQPSGRRRKLPGTPNHMPGMGAGVQMPDHPHHVGNQDTTNRRDGGDDEAQDPNGRDGIRYVRVTSPQFLRPSDGHDQDDREHEQEGHRPEHLSASINDAPSRARQLELLRGDEGGVPVVLMSGIPAHLLRHGVRIECGLGVVFSHRPEVQFTETLPCTVVELFDIPHRSARDPFEEIFPNFDGRHRMVARSGIVVSVRKVPVSVEGAHVLFKVHVPVVALSQSVSMPPQTNSGGHRKTAEHGHFEPGNGQRDPGHDEPQENTEVNWGNYVRMEAVVPRHIVEDEFARGEVYNVRHDRGPTDAERPMVDRMRRKLEERQQSRRDAHQALEEKRRDAEAIQQRRDRMAQKLSNRKVNTEDGYGNGNGQPHGDHSIEVRQDNFPHKVKSGIAQADVDRETNKIQQMERGIQSSEEALAAEAYEEADVNAFSGSHFTVLLVGCAATMEDLRSAGGAIGAPWRRFLYDAFDEDSANDWRWQPLQPHWDIDQVACSIVPLDAGRFQTRLQLVPPPVAGFNELRSTLLLPVLASAALAASCVSLAIDQLPTAKYIPFRHTTVPLVTMLIVLSTSGPFESRAVNHAGIDVLSVSGFAMYIAGGFSLFVVMRWVPHFIGWLASVAGGKLLSTRSKSALERACAVTLGLAIVLTVSVHSTCGVVLGSIGAGMTVALSPHRDHKWKAGIVVPPSLAFWGSSAFFTVRNAGISQTSLLAQNVEWSSIPTLLALLCIAASFHARRVPLRERFASPRPANTPEHRLSAHAAGARRAAVAFSVVSCAVGAGSFMGMSVGTVLATMTPTLLFLAADRVAVAAGLQRSH